MKIIATRLTHPLTILLFFLALWGCASAPRTNLAPDLYPSALLAEPIKMRAGFTHTTQPFEISGPDQFWEVSAGFARRDESLPFARLDCLVGSTNHRKSVNANTLIKHKCAEDDPVLHMKWELISSNSDIQPGFVFDLSKLDASSQWSKASTTIGLGAFTNQSKGVYRLKVTVLGDLVELEITDPHVVINKPIFRRR
jgi:hypothetical protein